MSTNSIIFFCAIPGERVQMLFYFTSTVDKIDIKNASPSVAATRGPRSVKAWALSRRSDMCT